MIRVGWEIMETKMRNKIFLVLTVGLLSVLLPFAVFAHSGRTDGSGGHKDNKNKSGLGGYHYHCGGYPAHLHKDGVCPYKGGSSSGSSANNVKSVPQTVYASNIIAPNMPEQINIGESTILKSSVYPENAEDKDIVWESSDTSILTVSEKGALTAVGAGTATITAKTSRGTSKSFVITVNEIVAENIAIQRKPGELIIGQNDSLSVAFIPENTTYKDVTWKSEDENIVSVDEKGKLTALAVGKTRITAIHKEITDSFEIEVKPILAESIDISCINDETGEEYEELKFEEGSLICFEALVLPADTTDPTVKWSVDNTDVAVIDETGKFTALAEGTVIVTAQTTNGITDTLEVEVYKTSVIVNIIAVIIVLLLIGGVIGGTVLLIIYIRKKIKSDRV